ncbi:HD domain-containing protein [Oceanobacillus massiliensis]|uniref:HD domain-containing protein n=1 Tax=Oceanobacillus massiliensis TaxID=1465765 RepID=UPI000288CDEC|nr:HD domain-containing protein [Oceanobacillus massiliensis]
MDRDQLESIQRYVYEAFKRDATGHDFYHMQRVVKLSGQIAEAEHADIALCEAAAWLHDIGDHKLFDNPEIAKKEMQQFLRSIAILESDISDIITIIDGVSYSKGETVPATLEGRIVQDADRLDAIGAIGIARTFAYGGANHQLIYHPSETKNSIQHFYDKLLRLRGLMHTNTAKLIAAERHQYMVDFIDQFFKEWK